jgi:hypothetical protein
MKKPVFKVGDQVTYKCTKDLPYGYVYGGNDIGGHVGEIIDILEYNSEHGCYEIKVTADCEDASCGAYTLLEFEVLEYDTIVESMSEDEDIDTDEDIDDEDGLSDEEENELYDLENTSRQFQVGDTVYIKKCDDYRYQTNSDIEKYYGKPGVVVYNYSSEFSSIQRCYDLEIEFNDSEEDRLWFLECELTKTEIQGEPESDTYPKLVKHTKFGDLMDYGDEYTHCSECCIYSGCVCRPEIKNLCAIHTSYYFAKSTESEIQGEPIEEVEKPSTRQYPDISKTLSCETDEIFVVSTKMDSASQISEDNHEDQFFANTTSTKIFNF